MGAELAKRLAKEGADVAVTARSADALQSMADDAKSWDGSIIPASADVTNAEVIRDTYAELKTALGGAPDLAIINAGLFTPMTARDFSADLFQKHVDVNLMGVAHVLEHVLPDMLARGAGHIAIVASVSGYRGLPKAAAYGSTKAALINLAESLRVELAPRGIVVQIVNPGFVDTPMTETNDFPMPFLMPLDKATDALYSGLKKGKFEITFPKRFTWQLKLLRILPYFLYFPLIRRATRSRR